MTKNLMRQIRTLVGRSNFTPENPKTDEESYIQNVRDFERSISDDVGIWRAVLQLPTYHPGDTDRVVMNDDLALVVRPDRSREQEFKFELYAFECSNLRKDLTRLKTAVGILYDGHGIGDLKVFDFYVDGVGFRYDVSSDEYYNTFRFDFGDRMRYSPHAHRLVDNRDSFWLYVSQLLGFDLRIIVDISQAAKLHADALRKYETVPLGYASTRNSTVTIKKPSFETICALMEKAFQHERKEVVGVDNRRYRGELDFELEIGDYRFNYRDIPRFRVGNNKWVDRPTVCELHGRVFPQSERLVETMGYVMSGGSIRKMLYLSR